MSGGGRDLVLGSEEEGFTDCLCPCGCFRGDVEAGGEEVEDKGRHPSLSGLSLGRAGVGVGLALVLSGKRWVWVSLTVFGLPGMEPAAKYPPNKFTIATAAFLGKVDFPVDFSAEEGFPAWDFTAWTVEGLAGWTVGLAGWTVGLAAWTAGDLTD